MGVKEKEEKEVRRQQKISIRGVRIFLDEPDSHG